MPRLPYMVRLACLNRSEQGLTLIEVLCAAVIFGLVIGVLWTTLGTTTDGLQRVRSGSKWEATLLAAHGRIETDLASAMNLDGELAFGGNSTGLEFTARIMNQTSPNVPIGEIVTIEYIWSPPHFGAAEGVLTRTQSQLNRTQGSKKASQTLLMAEQVAFEYYDQLGQRWRNTWEACTDNPLPSLVRVRIKSTSVGEEDPLSLTWAVQAGRVYVGTPGLR